MKGGILINHSLDSRTKNRYNFHEFLKREVLGNVYWGIGEMENTNIKGLTLWIEQHGVDVVQMQISFVVKPVTNASDQIVETTNGVPLHVIKLDSEMVRTNRQTTGKMP